MSAPASIATTATTPSTASTAATRSHPAPPNPQAPLVPLPWWRCGPVWLLLGALAVAVLASSAFAAVAIATGDPDVGAVVPRAQRAHAAVQPDAPALQGRNHAATPRP